MLPGMTIRQIAEALATKQLSSLEVTEAYLERIRAEDGDMQAYLAVTEDEAYRAAKRSDERRFRGETVGLLDGVPIALKDNISTQDIPTTAGSKMLEGYLPPQDATVAERVKRAGMVLLGKTNLDEFAMGSSTEYSAFGPTKHPTHADRVPGGSSGGSAAAVARDLAPASLGSDTGGSIRQPASFCGIVGFKPTYGTVSRSGVIAMASSFDQVGPMTKTVDDAATLFDVLRGADPHDLTTTDRSLSPFTSMSRLDGVRIGLPRQAWGHAGMSASTRFACEQAVEVMKVLGAEVKEVDLPYADEALAVYYVLVPAEVSANLARYDGIRYGSRAQAETLLEVYERTRGEGFGPEVRRRILLGSYVLSKGSVDAYYHQARKVRKLIVAAYERLFTEVDMLVTPTTPSTAFRLGEKINDPLALYLEDIFTVGVNVAGVPALSIPCGREPETGLPIGIQLIGKRFDDGRLLSFGHAYESV